LSRKEVIHNFIREESYPQFVSDGKSDVPPSSTGALKAPVENELEPLRLRLHHNIRQRAGHTTFVGMKGGHKDNG
jgi:hypothetical protein